MESILRDSTLGSIIRVATKGRLLKYPEEEDNFELPASYGRGKSIDSTASSQSPHGVLEKELDKDAQPPTGHAETHHALTTAPTVPDEATRDEILSQIMSRPQLSNISSRKDLEKAFTNASLQESLKKQPSRPIAPTKTSDGTVLVDFYSTDDPANPQNWTTKKKTFVLVQIYLYTLAVYMGSSIITPSQPYIEEIFHVSPQAASLGLSMYVLGYGIGPLIFSPLSEIPSIGRNPPYIITFSIFMAISIGTACVNNFPALIVLRFLQGFFGSPCLATGGASIGDMYSLLQLPYYLCGWAVAATGGPALGPIISGFSVPKTNWHWSLWEIVWLAAPVYITLFIFLPETGSSTILLRRAQRLRKLTGNNAIRSQSEIDEEKMKVSEVLASNLWRPIQMNALDPTVLFTSLYIALVYGIFYSWFEVFPWVYAIGLPTPGSPTHGYGMNAGEIGLIFLSITIGVFIAIPAYLTYHYFIYDPKLRAHGLGAPEVRLIPGLYASLLLPIGLFIFGWTSFNSPKIHWIVPTIGIVIVTIGLFIIFQVIFIYLALTYPQYAASLFAGNDFARSSVAAGAIHFSRPLFLNMGVGPGVSVLGGLTVLGVIGIWTLWAAGPWLRARSKFTAK